MTYRELVPPPALAAHVACLWSSSHAPERILPDGCIDIVWTGTGLIVAGPATRAVIPAAQRKDQVAVGLRFRVGAAGPALGLPAAELLDQAPPLEEIWTGRDGRQLAERIAEADGPAARIGVLAELVGERLRDAPAPDPLLRAAVLAVARPRTSIARLAGRLAISERQLRRRFDDGVGYAPKTLARVLRMQRFVALAADGGELARLAADAGYADQAHLTRECTQLAGLPASALLRSGAGPAGEARVLSLVAA